MKKLQNPIRFFFSKDAEDGYVPNRELFAYSAALFGQNASFGMVSQWLNYFMTNVLFISSGKTGTVMGVVRVWDAVNDPVVGTLIDRHKFKNGNKLHPYLGKLAIVIGLLTALLFVDFGLNETAALLLIFFVYIAWDMTYSFQDVALWGMMSLITPHSGERARVSQWINIGASAGGAIVGAVPFLLGLRTAVGMSERQMLLLCAILFGLGGELVSILAMKTKERVAFVQPERQSLLEDLKEIRYNRTLLLLILAQLSNSISGAIPWIYYFKYCVEVNIGSFTMNGETAQTVYGILIGALGTVSMFFAVRIADRVGSMKNLIILAQAGNVLLRVIAYFIGFDTIPQMLAVIVLMAVGNIPVTLIGIAQKALLSDSIDYMEWKTGKRKEGITFSLQNLTSKMTEALKSFLFGAIFTVLSFDAELPVQTDKFLDAQWPLFMLLPALASFLYLIPFVFIKDNKAEKQKIEAELAERHATKAAGQTQERAE